MALNSVDHLTSPSGLTCNTTPSCYRNQQVSRDLFVAPSLSCPSVHNIGLNYSRIFEEYFDRCQAQRSEMKMSEKWGV